MLHRRRLEAVERADALRRLAWVDLAAAKETGGFILADVELAFAWAGYANLLGNAGHWKQVIVVWNLCLGF